MKGKIRNPLSPTMLGRTAEGIRQRQRLKCPLQNLVASPKQFCDLSLPVLFINP